MKSAYLGPKFSDAEIEAELAFVVQYLKSFQKKNLLMKLLTL